MEAFTTHWYPDYIRDPIHKMRSMRIIVKENASFDGISQKFKDDLDKKDIEKEIRILEKEIRKLAEELNFEKAIAKRDEMKALKELLLEL